MARLVGPDEASRLVYGVRSDKSLTDASGLIATVYADAAGTTLANILTYPGGAAIPNSQLTVGTYSLLPLFQFPDGVDTVWVKVGSGPITEVHSNYDARLDALTVQTHVFDVTRYGAIGNGVADDTAAINAAVTAAYNAGVANGTNYAEVYFPPATYLLSSPTTKTATNKGNAQIPLPVVATTGQKFTLVLRGTRSATALPHWQQTTPQRAGATLVSTLVNQVVDATFGPPSVVGGPTPVQGYGGTVGLFSNMLVVVDGVSISVPANPTLLGFDFSGVAEMNVISASVNASTTPGTAEPIKCTNTWAVGLYTPQSRNNDLCLIQDISVEGMYFGMVLSEHATVLHGQVVYCDTGVDILTGQDFILINYLSVELCRIVLSAEAFGAGLAKVRVAMLDVEQEAAGNFALVQVINDPNNLLRGEINVHTLASTGSFDVDPLVNGATFARIIRTDRWPGSVAAPSVPATTVALLNPFWRDAVVTITGGTVTAVTVDGVATGLTSGTVVVPTGRSITLTYSVAPTWTWTLL